MSDYGRVSPNLHNHRKVVQAGNDAMGLWVRALSWCKWHRSGGHIPTEEALALGTAKQCEALVQARLWEETPKGYQFRDWDDWSGERNIPLAARIVHKALPPGHPESVKQALAKQVGELLDDGVEPRIIAAGVERWLEKPGAPPSWLPLMVSDVLRGDTESFEAAIEAALETGDVAPLAKYGYIFTPPDPPASIKTAAEMRAYMLKKKRQWIRSLRNG